MCKIKANKNKRRNMLNLIFSNLYNCIYLIRHADKTYLYDKTLYNIYIQIF